MIRKYLFSEELGRNIIWVMLSGFFLKIGAKENLLGQIIMPEDHYLFNLDDNNLDQKYKNFKHLHYIFFDGATEFLNDQRFKKIDRKINIYYVGRLNSFWKNIDNSQPLFSSNENIESNIKEIKKKFPIFFKKYFLKCFLTSLINFKEINLSINHIFGKKKFVYYGYIKPSVTLLAEYEKQLGIKNFNYDIFFQKTNSIEELKIKIKQICDLKNSSIKSLDSKKYPYLNEFLLFMIRNLICNIIKDKENFLIFDGLGGYKNFNAYEMFFGNQHTYIDLGSKVGFDKIYPRNVLLRFFGRHTERFNLEENFFTNDEKNSYLHLYESIIYFLNKLNIKI